MQFAKFVPLFIHYELFYSVIYCFMSYIELDFSKLYNTYVEFCPHCFVVRKITERM